jgi:Spy/CpxP family protein refolding chaperone
VLRGGLAEMATELDLTREQKIAMAERAAERDAALRQWDAGAGLRMEAVQKAIAAARASGDKKALDLNAQEFNALRHQRAAVGRRYDRDIYQLLTPEQQARWTAYHTHHRYAAVPFRHLKLTQEQERAIKDRFLAARDELHGAADGDAREAIARRIRDEAEAEVLTDEQRLKLNAERDARIKPKPTKTKGR